ncbi:MAG: hypothetical protein K2Q25_00760 [Mycobacteriaceae bacterium]|nr:hypothetical protein [Mycobacteriaceae bacterium]
MATLLPLYRNLVVLAVVATAGQGYTDVMQAKDGDPGPAVEDAVTLGLLGTGIGVVSRLEQFLPGIERIDGSTVELSKISANRAAATVKIEQIQAMDNAALAGTALGAPFVSAEQCQEVVGLVGTFVASTDRLADIVLPGVPVALIFVQTLRLLNGFGVPDKGEEFRDSAAAFLDAESDFGQVSSSGAWVGVAADHYGELAASRRAGAASIQEADRKLADILHAQAAQVRHAGIGLAAIDPICMLALLYIFWLRRALIAECDRLVTAVLTWAAEHANAAAANFERPNAIKFWSDNLTRNNNLLKEIISIVYKYLAQFAAIVTGVMLVAGAAAITMLSILIDHGRSNAREIGSVTEMYRSVVAALAADLPAGGVPTASVAPVVQPSEFGGGRSESFGPAALMSRLKG